MVREWTRMNGFEEWRFLWWRSMSMHAHLRILCICFLRYQENSHPENFHQSNSPLVNPPWNIPTWIIPAHVFKYYRPSFFFFFHYCYRYHWYYLKLKRLVCNSMFQKHLSLYVCENLSKRSVKWRKEINEMGGNNPDGNFLGANFPGGVWWVEIFWVGIPSGEGIFIEPFSSYNASIFNF